jgi:hypothetical protein
MRVDKVQHLLVYEIASTSNGCFVLRNRALRMRIFDRPLQAPDAAWKNGARVLGLTAAQSDHEGELLAEIRFGRLGSVAGDIDAGLPHGFNRVRIEIRGFTAGTRHIEAISGQMPEKALRHLGSARVVGTEKQNPGLDHSTYSFLN